MEFISNQFNHVRRIMEKDGQLISLFKNIPTLTIMLILWREILKYCDLEYLILFL